MIHRILIEETPFGVRAAALDDDGPFRLIHSFSQRSEPRFGELFQARVGRRDDRLGAQLCDLGGGTEGLLVVKGRQYPEGTQILVGIRREAIGDKRPVLTDRPVLRLPAATFGRDGAARPGPLGEVPPSERAIKALQATSSAPGRVNCVPEAVRLLGVIASSATGQIVCSSGVLGAAIRPYLPEGADLVTDATVGAVINAVEDEALDRTVAFEGGGALVIDEAEALTAIDVDLGRGGGRSAKGAADNLKRRAFQALGHALSLRAIGGQAVLDLPRAAVRAPKMLRDQLTALLKPAGLSSIPAVTKEGLAILILGQNRRSVLRDLTEEEASGVLRPGRGWRGDILAWRAFAAAVEALEERPAARFELRLPKAAGVAWKAAGADVAMDERFGGRLEVAPADAVDFKLDEVTR